MHIEKLARKLEPLLPKEVERWQRRKETANPDTAALLDKQLILLARRALGDYRKKILLSLPPEKNATGAIHLGTILYEKTKWPIGLSCGELLQNLAIFGRSGAGKTNLAFHILEQLSDRGIPFLFLDWKRTGRHLIPRLGKKVKVYTPGRSLSPFPFNPLIPPPGLEKQIYANQMIDVLSSAYTLRDAAQSVLQKAVQKCYAEKDEPTMSDLKKAVETQSDKGRTAGWKATALRALSSLEISGIGDGNATSQTELVRSLTKCRTIIELDSLNQSAKKFLIPMLCLWIYYLHLGKREREKVSLVIFFEEAHHVFYKQELRARESVMDMLMRQCRELGISIVVVDQHPHLISSAALGNTYTSIFLNLKDPTDINKAAAVSLVDSEEKHYFTQLPVGQAIVKLQDRWRTPFLIQIPKVSIKKGAITDSILKDYVGYSGQKEAGSTGKTLEEGKSSEFRQAPRKDYLLNPPVFRTKPPSEDAFTLIEDILQHPNDGVKARYHRLPFGTNKAHRLKTELIRNGFIEEHMIPVGNTRKIILRLTQEAMEFLGLNPNTPATTSDALPRNESLPHEYWKTHYAEVLRNKGYTVEIESPRANGRTDLLALKNGRKIAIEIETGKSNATANVRNNLLTGVDKVIVVATDRKALKKIETELTKEHLLIPPRVTLILAGSVGLEDQLTL